MRQVRLTIGTRSVGFGMLLLGVFYVLFSWPVNADSSVARGFEANDSKIVPGAIVSLDQSAPGTVELSTLSNRTQLVGVAGAEALIEFVNGEPIHVVTSGATTTLVTDLNGTIKAGDKITPSPIAGVGMKATESVMVVGTAENDLNVSKAETRQVVTKSGEKRTAHIGSISLQVGPTFYQGADVQTLVPSAFQNLVNGVAGRTVSPVRIMVAGLIILLMLGAVIALIYSSVRSSIIALGRNPLSGQAVHKGLFDVGVTAFGVLAFTIIIVYLILIA